MNIIGRTNFNIREGNDSGGRRYDNKGGVTDKGGLGWRPNAPKMCVGQVRHVYATDVHVVTW